MVDNHMSLLNLSLKKDSRRRNGMNGFTLNSCIKHIYINMYVVKKDHLGPSI